MKVETYEVISVDEQNGAIVNDLVSEEALALIEQLDLKGQRELVAETKCDGETVVTRNPYRRMTAEEMAIFGTVLPQRHLLRSYADGPIPLRVLQIAAHAKDLFDQLQVWCPDPGQQDPLLVGQKGGHNHDRANWLTTSGEFFILARWGEILEPLDVLRTKAAGKLISKARAEIAEAKGNLATFEMMVERSIDSFLQGNAATGFFASINFAR